MECDRIVAGMSARRLVSTLESMLTRLRAIDFGRNRTRMSKSIREKCIERDAVVGLVSRWSLEGWRAHQANRARKCVFTQ